MEGGFFVSIKLLEKNVISKKESFNVFEENSLTLILSGSPWFMLSRPDLWRIHAEIKNV